MTNDPDRVRLQSFPLVTIITPSYNQSVFIEQTIRSVLAQDYPAIEYIVVDGASTDGSQDIIRAFQNRLAWWISEPDSGQAEAINKGLKRARGEFVAWLNSDDLYLPGAVSSAVTVLQRNPQVGMVYGDALTIDTQGRPLNKLIFSDWGLVDLIGFRMICQPAVFMRRGVVEQAGYLNPSFHYMLDHFLWISMARLAPIGHETQIWAAARHHPAAKNVSQAEGFSHETIRLLEWMQKQPDLANLIAENHKKVLAGAYRLSARYLLDGGAPGAALHWYGQALLTDPGYALKHWHRMLYAVLCLIHAEGLLAPLRRSSSDRQRRRLLKELSLEAVNSSTSASPFAATAPSLKNWPGLNLSPEP